jgi:hypothetical protein
MIILKGGSKLCKKEKINYSKLVNITVKLKIIWRTIQHCLHGEMSLTHAETAAQPATLPLHQPTVQFVCCSHMHCQRPTKFAAATVNFPESGLPTIREKNV